jgi:hypothetical protein
MTGSDGIGSANGTAIVFYFMDECPVSELNEWQSTYAAYAGLERSVSSMLTQNDAEIAVTLRVCANQELASKDAGESSAVIRARVNAARSIQLQ